MRKLGKKLLTLLATLSLFVGTISTAPVTVLADAGDVPQHNKTINSNGDGTYKLELSVTGDADTTTTTATANILVVYDASTSMNWNIESATGSMGSTYYGYNPFQLYKNTGTTARPNYVALTDAEAYTGTVYQYNQNNRRYTEYTGTRYTTQTRNQAAEKTVYDFANGLFGYSGVEMALVTFNNSDSRGAAVVIQDWTDNKNTYLNHLASNGTSTKLTYASGTNWEAGLRKAVDVLDGTGTLTGADSDPTFVIFVTDGAPQQNVSHPTPYTVNQHYFAAIDEARDIEQYQTTGAEEPNTTFFGIYAFGNEEDFLDDLVYYSQNGTERSNVSGNTVATPNYYNANNSAALEAAIEDIFEQIASTLGISAVSMEDGTTAAVATSTGEIAELLEVDETSYEYWLSIPQVVNNQFTRVNPVTGDTVTFTLTNNNDGTYTITWGSNSVTVTGTLTSGVFKYKWESANAFYNYNPPTAEFVDGAVDWDLKSVGTLLNGVTYSVTFDVYPSQYTYDLIADLKNGTVTYASLDANIRKYLSEDYALTTNTTATLSYTDTRTDDGPQTSNFNTLGGVPTVSSAMTVSKSWDPITEATDITMTVTKDGENFYDVEMTAANNYTATVNISTGLIHQEYEEDNTTIKSVKILDQGHDYAFSEMDDSSYYWDLDVETVRPMLINSATVISSLVLVENEAKAAEINTAMGSNIFLQEDGKTYYKVAGHIYELSTSGATGNLTATNTKRSYLSLYKNIEGDDPGTAEFTFDLTVNAAFDPHKQEVTANGDGTYNYTNLDGISVTVDANGKALYYTEEGNSVVLYGTVTTTGTGEDAISTYTYQEAIWFSMWDYNTSSMVMGLSPTNWTAEVNQSGAATGYYYAPNGTKLHIDNMTSHNNIRFGNVPAGTTYTFTESATMPENYVFSSAEVWGDDDVARVVTDSRSVSSVVAKSNKDYGVTFTNAYDKTKITVNKVWEKDEESSVDVQLYANGAAVAGSTQTLNEAGNWTYTYADLETGGNNPIRYTVLETPVDGYKTVYTGTTDIVVSVLGATGTVEATILVDGEEVGDPVALTDENGHKIRVTGVDFVNEDGTAKEITVQSENENVTFTYENRVVNITNTRFEPATVTIPVKKVLSVPEGLEGPASWSYDFTLTPSGSAPAASPATVTISNSTSDTASFGEITFNDPGTYTYTVTENGTVAGVTNDAAATSGKTVTVTVTDNNGVLSAVATSTTEDPLTFTNTYSADPVTVSFPVEKILASEEGLTPPNTTGKYTFTLTAEDGTPVPATLSYTNPDADGGTVTFGPISYSGKGNYTYTITESGTVAGVTNDTAAESGKTVTVSVVDNKDGTLTATASSTAQDPLTFTNTYEVTEVTATPSVTKELSAADGLNPPDITGEYTFTLRADSSSNPMPASGGDVVTNPDADGGTASFGSIKFNKPGTYVYTVTEAGTVAGITNDTAASTGKKITIVVNDNGDGTLSIDESSTLSQTFTNTYSVSPISGTVQAKKILDTNGYQGPDITNQYTFTAAGSENAPALENTSLKNAQPTVTFGTVEFSKPGTYTYTITESGTVTGVTNDADAASGKTLTFTVTDNQDGTLSVNGSKTAVTLTAEFTNVFNTEPVTNELHAKKVLTGRKNGTADSPAKNGEFSFQLKDAEGKVLQTVTNDGDGMIDFAAISYSTPGTYTYTISEVAGSDSHITYTTDVATVVVTVTDNTATTGKLEVTSVKYNDTEYDETAPYTFTNTYTPDPVTAAPAATKVMSGPRSLAEGEFSFQLLNSEGTPVQTKTNAADGSVSFDALTFTEVGTYTYTIKEVIPADAEKLPGVTYDTHEETVTFTVTDNEAGSLLVSVGYDTDGAVFTNVFTPGTLEGDDAINGDKTLTGRDMKPGEVYTFTLTGGDDATNAAIASHTVVFNDDAAATSLSATVSGGKDGVAKGFIFDKITFYAPGTYSFNVSETAGSEGGVTYDTSVKSVTVTVESVTRSDDGKTVLTASWPSEQKPSFNNTYSASASITPEGTKVLKNGETDLTIDQEFTFNVTYSDGSAAGTGTISSGNAISFSALNYTTTGENSLQALVAANKATVSVGEDGLATYTINYTVNENTPSNPAIQANTQTLTFQVKVKDNGDGTLTPTIDYGSGLNFINTYTTDEATVTADGTKVLNGRELEADMFSFTLSGVDGAPIHKQTEEGYDTVDSLSATNEAGGAVHFGTLVFTKGDLGDASEMTFTYEITEANDGKAGISYAGPQRFTVTVTDDGEGHLTAVTSPAEVPLFTFTNTYTPTPVTSELPVRKVLNGRALNAGEFSFTMIGNGYDSTVSNDAQGNATFTGITFNKSGNYSFTVSEVQGSLPAVTYDSRTYTVTAVVTDNFEDASLSVEWDLGENITEIVFTNTYVPEAAKATIEVEKALAGRDLQATEFSFTLSENGEVLQTANNTADGKVTFGEITYLLENKGTHTYTIAEVVPDEKLPGVEYSTETITVTVEVTDDGQGALHATVTYPEDKTFNNTYTPEPTSIDLGVTKALTSDNNRPLKAGEFTFQLLDANGEVLEEVTNDAEGKVSFKTINYEKADLDGVMTKDFVYTIREVKGTEKGVTYDEHTVTATVTVKDDANGKMSATVEYSGEVTFTNTYEPEPVDVVLEAKKSYDGTLEDDMFSFELISGGAVYDTKKNVGGNVTFKELHFEEVGTYEYTIKEVKGDDLVAYDEHEVAVKIVVSDNFEGDLVAEVTYDDGKVPYTFVNHELVNIDVTKVWEDYNDYDGDRPESIIVNLLANDEPVDEAEITSENNWKHSFTDLRKYDDKGELITYTVSEEPVEKYETKIEGFTITNTHTPLTEIEVTKEWNDREDKLEVQPDEIEVKLYREVRGGEKELVQTVKFGEKNDWMHIFQELPVFDEESETQYIYTLEETEIPNYVGNVELAFNAETKRYTAKITNELKFVDLTIKKELPAVYDLKQYEGTTFVFKVTVDYAEEGKSYENYVGITIEEGTYEYSKVLKDIPCDPDAGDVLKVEEVYSANYVSSFTDKFDKEARMYEFTFTNEPGDVPPPGSGVANMYEEKEYVQVTEETPSEESPVPVVGQ
ncbi:MAG: Cna B-type domain-containing protein [Erysipelotrichaceae bacterium]|nr:Cna B-type domain-containing protein [Erysipelotrichaceae bacterium]